FVLAATYRSDLVGPNHPLWSAVLAVERLPTTVRIELEPLTSEQVRAQIEAIGGPPVPPVELEQLVGRAGGNPFFVEELLAPAGRGALRASIRDVLLDRFGALSDGARRVVRAVAVAGRGATDEMLAAMLEESPEALEQPLREAVDGAVLEVRGDGYEFRH